MKGAHCREEWNTLLVRRGAEGNGRRVNFEERNQNHLEPNPHGEVIPEDESVQRTVIQALFGVQAQRLSFLASPLFLDSLAKMEINLMNIIYRDLGIFLRVMSCTESCPPVPLGEHHLDYAT